MIIEAMINHERKTSSCRVNQQNLLMLHFFHPVIGKLYAPILYLRVAKGFGLEKVRSVLVLALW